VAAQSASAVQVVGQAWPAPSHRYGEQVGEPDKPLATGEQVPLVADRAQEAQAPVQAVSQQTRATQKPLVQSWLPSQSLPGGSFGLQLLVPGSQKVPLTQSPSDTQIMSQALPAQT
jgi:hypothetical protein